MDKKAGADSAGGFSLFTEFLSKFGIESYERGGVFWITFFTTLFHLILFLTMLPFKAFVKCVDLFCFIIDSLYIQIRAVQTRSYKIFYVFSFYHK